MDDDITTPATEIEIAEVMRWASERDCLIVRKLAFERDRLRDSREKMEQAAVSAASSIIDNWNDWDGEAQQAAQQDQDERSYRHVMMTNIASRLWREFGWPMREGEEMKNSNLLLHPKRDLAWRSRSMTTKELLDVLRRNHLALGRDDSPYWQAEQAIRELLQTMDMIASCARACGHQDDVCIDEIKRLAETAAR